MKLRKDSKLVVGIPTVKRPRDYLHDCLDSLIPQLPRPMWERVEVAVFNADTPPERHTQATELAARYREFADAGRLTVLTSPAVHPELLHWSVPEAASASGRRMAWEAKLALDGCYLFDACANRGDYYLHLEDDTVAAKDFWFRLAEWFDGSFAGRDDWTVLHLYSTLRVSDKVPYSPETTTPAAVCMLMRCRDLPEIARYVRSRFNEAPFDSLLGQLVAERGEQVYYCVPSLVQHVGVLSSSGDETMSQQSPTFEESRVARLRRNVREVVEVGIYRPRLFWRAVRSHLPKPAMVQRLVDVGFDALLPLVRRFRRRSGRSAGE